jgi:hypothetical protein
VRGAHIIGKRLVDEAMRLVNAKQVTDIRVCKCAMSGSIQRVLNDFKHNRPAGMVRFDFLVDGEHRSVLLNAGYIIQHYKATHVQS